MCFLRALGVYVCVCGGGGGCCKGLVHNLRMQFLAQRSSKIEVSDTYSFDIVTTHNDHPSYVTHVLVSIHVFLGVHYLG